MPWNWLSNVRVVAKAIHLEDKPPNFYQYTSPCELPWIWMPPYQRLWLYVGGESSCGFVELHVLQVDSCTNKDLTKYHSDLPNCVLSASSLSFIGRPPKAQKHWWFWLCVACFLSTRRSRVAWWKRWTPQQWIHPLYALIWPERPGTISGPWQFKLITLKDTMKTLS